MCIQAVYHMPTDDEAAQGSMALALQSLFYKVTGPMQLHSLIMPGCMMND